MLSMAEGISFCVHIGLDGCLTNDHLSESSLSASFIGHEKRESGESEVFLRLKSLICRKKRSFEGKISRITGNSFRITTIRATFVSNIQQAIYMKTIEDTPPDQSGRP